MRKGKKQYVHDDRALQDVLAELGSAEATLEYQLDGAGKRGSLDARQFQKLLSQLASLEGLLRLVQQHGIPSSEYLTRRNGEGAGRFPLYRVLHVGRKGKKRQLFLHSEREYADFVRTEQDKLKKFGEELEIIEEDDYEGLARGKNAPNTVLPRKFHEAAQIARAVSQVEAHNIPISYLLPGKKEGGKGAEFRIRSNGEEVVVATLSEITSAVKDLGRKGLEIERYKGLGEMNAGELAETTLKPESRTLVRVTVGDAVRANNYFSILAGKDVKRRREFIEMHALEAHDLDV